MKNFKVIVNLEWIKQEVWLRCSKKNIKTNFWTYLNNDQFDNF